MTDEERRRRLVALGYNPDEYDLLTPEEHAARGMGAGEAFTTGAGSAIGPGIGGGLGLAAAIGLGLSGPPGWAAMIGMPILGGVLGGFGQSGVEGQIYTPEEQAALSAKRRAARTEHPYASLAGEFVPSLLSGRPSLTNLRNLPGALSRAPLRGTLSELDRYTLASSALGGGLGAGLEAGSAYLSDEDINLGRVLGAGLGGATLTEVPSRPIGSLGARIAGRRGISGREFLRERGLVRPPSEREMIDVLPEVRERNLKKRADEAEKHLSSLSEKRKVHEVTVKERQAADKTLKESLDKAKTDAAESESALEGFKKDPANMVRYKSNARQLLQKDLQKKQDYITKVEDLVKKNQEELAEASEAEALYRKRYEEAAPKDTETGEPAATPKVPKELLKSARGLAEKLGIDVRDAVREIAERDGLKGIYRGDKHEIQLSAAATDDTPFHEVLHGLWQVMKRRGVRKHEDLLAMIEEDLFTRAPGYKKDPSRFGEEVIVQLAGRKLRDRLDNPPTNFVGRLDRWWKDVKLEWSNKTKGEGEALANRLADWLAMHGDRAPVIGEKQLEGILDGLSLDIRGRVIAGVVGETTGRDRYARAAEGDPDDRVLSEQILTLVKDIQNTENVVDVFGYGRSPFVEAQDLLINPERTKKNKRELKKLIKEYDKKLNLGFFKAGQESYKNNPRNRLHQTELVPMDKVVKHIEANVLRLDEHGLAVWRAAEGDRYQTVSDEDYMTAATQAELDFVGPKFLEMAEEMVNNAALASGFTSPLVLHGRPKGAKFTEFSPQKVGLNTGAVDTQQGEAYFFGTDGATAHTIGKLKSPEGAELIKARLKLDNPLDSSLIFPRDVDYDSIKTDNLAVLIKAAKAQGNDGVIYRNKTMGDVYVAFKPAQIKSVEPITRDNKDNIIPLSKRFDVSKKDYRYQTADAEDLGKVFKSVATYDNVMRRKYSRRTLSAIIKGAAKDPAKRMELQREIMRSINRAFAQGMSSDEKAAALNVAPLHHGTPNLDEIVRSGFDPAALNPSANKGPGIYVTADDYAAKFGPDVVAVNTRIRKPLDLDEKFSAKDADAFVDAYVKKAEELGHEVRTGRAAEGTFKERSAALANAQHEGPPETAMHAVQRATGGGRLSQFAEHGGDLTHRMAQAGGRYHAGHPYMEEKLNALNWVLKRPGYLEKELKENAFNNAQGQGLPLEIYQKNVDDALYVYANAHRKLQTHNEAQTDARDLAVAIGEQRWDEVRRLTTKLKKAVDKGPESWEKYALKDDGLDKLKGFDVDGDSMHRRLATLHGDDNLERVNDIVADMGYDSLTYSENGRRVAVLLRRPFDNAQSLVEAQVAERVRTQSVDDVLKGIGEWTIKASSDFIATNPLMLQPAIMDSVLDKVLKMGRNPTQRKYAKEVHTALYNAAREAVRLQGRYIEAHEVIAQHQTRLNNNDMMHIMNYMVHRRYEHRKVDGEWVSDTPMPDDVRRAVESRPELKERADWFWKMYSEFRGEEVAEGRQIRNRKGELRAPGKLLTPEGEPNYVPLVIHQQMRRALMGKDGVDAQNLRKKELVDFYEERAKVVGDDVSRTELEDAVNDFISKLTSDADNIGAGAVHFKALHKTEGYGLPMTRNENGEFMWIEPIASNAYSRYMRRASLDFSFFKNVEANPVLRMVLGLPGQDGKRMRVLDDNETPFHVPKTKQVDDKTGDITYIAKGSSDNEEFTDFVKAYLGYYQGQELVGRTVNRLVTSHWLGIGSGVRDMFSSYLHALPYMRMRDLPLLLKSWKDVKARWVDSHLSGVNRTQRNRIEFATESIDQMTSRIDAWSDRMTRITGRNQLERLTRGFQFALGHDIARSYAIASKKDRTAWRTFSTLCREAGLPADELRMRAAKGSLDEKSLNELAAAWVDINQGTYDVRGVPLWTLRGSASLFTSLSRWNFEKANRMRSDILMPLIDEGDPYPLIKATVGAMVVGAAGIELMQYINNRYSSAPTVRESLKELDPEQTFYSLADTLNYVGYFGIVSAMINDLAITTLRGQRPGAGGVVFPALDFVSQGLYEPLYDVVDAVNQGEDFLPTFFSGLNDVVKNTTQSYRIAWAQTVDRMSGEAERRKDRRDLRMFRMFEGEKVSRQPTGVGNPYLRRRTRDFKESETLGEAFETLPAAFEEQVVRAEGRGDKLRSYAQGLYTISDKSMPSVATVEGVEEFLRYKDFVMRQRGGGHWERILDDWARRKNLTADKKMLVKSYVQHLAR